MLQEHKRYLSNGNFIFLALSAVVFLVLSLVVNWYAGLYATESASNAVTDVVLSNVRVYDVDGLFIYGTIAFWAFVFFMCIREPNILPFTVKSIALFVVIRAVFISLTHIGPFPSQMVVDSNVMAKFAFGGDLFFSGHTGLPFLMALIFWKRFYLRVLFIASSVTFGIVVLLAHLHYTIDVLSAFFITYTIYHIAEKFFAEERRLFYSGLTRKPN